MIAKEPQLDIPQRVRRNIFDYLRVQQVVWAGELQETDFLSRLYDLEELPTTDHRFKSMAGDIWQHRVNNPMDWDDDWVYSDSRLNLYGCPDEEFLSFLGEILHPIVRPNSDEVEALSAFFNECLARSGWQLIPESQLAGKPVYTAQQLMPTASLALDSAGDVAETLNAEYVTRQVSRMRNSIDTDPELAVGTAKEFLETICKTILDACGHSYGKSAKILDLVKLVRKELQLLPDDIHEKAKGADTVKRILSNLGTAAQGIAELRGLYGTGHGKAAGSGGIQPRHARLTVGAAATLGVFLFDTYQERIKKQEAK